MASSANQSATVGGDPDFEPRLLASLLRGRAVQSLAHNGILANDGCTSLVDQQQLETLWGIVLEYLISRLSEHVQKRILEQEPAFQGFMEEIGTLEPEPEHRDILLLVLQASLYKDSTIVCTLCAVDIGSKIHPEYEVLSCGAGGGAEMKPIQLNDKIVQVSENLETALKHLRHPWKPRHMWVDTLCAGKTNPHIDTMKKIYAQAQQMVMWLGQESDISPIALSFARNIAEQSHDNQRLLISWLSNRPDTNLTEYKLGGSELMWAYHYRPATARPAIGFVHSLPKVPIRDEHSRLRVVQESDSITADAILEAILGLMRRDWCDRVWILQDLVGRCKAQVQCGRSVTPWEELAGLLDLVREVELGDHGLSATFPTDHIRRTLLYHHNFAALAMEYGYRGSGVRVFRPFQKPHVRPPLMDHIIAQTCHKLANNSESLQKNTRLEESSCLIEAFASSIARIFERPNGAVNRILAAAKVAGSLGLILSQLSVRVSGRCVRRIRGDMVRSFVKDIEDVEDLQSPSERVGDDVESGEDDDAKTRKNILRKLKLIGPGETLDELLQRLRQQELDRGAAMSLPGVGLPLTKAAFDDKRDLQCWLDILHTLSPGSACERHCCHSELNEDAQQPEHLLSPDLADCTLSDKAEQASTRADVTKDPNISGTCEGESRDSEIYTYEPLDSAAKEIRLMLLYPSKTPDSDIHVDLTRVSLRRLDGLGIDRYPYVALSYVWGDGPSEKIYLHGSLKSVTPNLFAALRRLRDPRLPLLLWVDALCIDQDNIVEKGQQIPLMGSIYSKAGHVWVWLGEDEPDTGKLMLSLAIYDYEMALSRYPADPKVQERLKEVRELAKSMDQLSILLKIWKRPYWTRVWIVQEILLAQEATVCCGPYIASWEAYKAVSGYYGDLQLTNVIYSGKDMPPPAKLAEIHARRVAPIDKGGGLSLLDAFIMGRTRLATNPRDYIYAFLGVCDLGPSKIIPDYKKDLLCVTMNAFRCIIEETSNLDILSACRQYDTREDFDKAVAGTWPTWLPDWSLKYCDNSSEMTSMLLSNRGGRCYSAAGETEPRVEYSKDGLLLMLNGIDFDTVEYVPDDDWPDSMERNWTSYLKIFKEGSPYRTERSQHVALAETTFLSQTTFPPKTLLIPYDEDHLIYRAESYLGFSFDGSDRITKEIREDIEFLEEKEVIEAYHAITSDHRGEFRAMRKRCDASNTIGDEFLTCAGEKIAFSDLDDNKLVEISQDSLYQLNVWYDCSGYKSKFFVTKQGYIGRGPISMRKGDRVCIFFGAKVPFILREESPGVYVLLGEGYVYGIMKGEAIKGHKDDCRFVIK